MQLSDDVKFLLNVRRKRHERFHTRCAFEKRNTVEGVVKWIITSL
jgi:hypothetical protein